jgi:hypothetical protein
MGLSVGGLIRVRVRGRRVGSFDYPFPHLKFQHV